MKTPFRSLFTVSVCCLFLITLSQADEVSTNVTADGVEASSGEAEVASAGAGGSEAAEETSESGTLDSFFDKELPDAIGQSKINFQWRPRYEYADSETTKPSKAFTMRTMFGLTTAEIYGFQGMIEGLNVSSLGGSGNYNSLDEPSDLDKTPVLDPPTTEINQAWLRYTYTNWATSAKGGRQKMNLDNQRFVGAVDWRQNQQTFDAIQVGNSSVKDLELMYSYIGRVNRVGGNVSGLAAPLKDFQSQSHVFHGQYGAWEYAKLTGYIYLLDLNNNGVGDAFSSASYGVSVDGAVSISEDIPLNYRGEFAIQTDYAGNPTSYNAPYAHLTIGTRIKPVSFGVGYELLGTDNSYGFQTPLATLHKFNGWADVFLVTPTTGLQDFYAYAQVELPWEMPLKVAIHKFDASNGGRFNYGNELDISLSKKLGKHWAALIKYAYYDARNGFAITPPPGAAGGADVHRFWLQVDFKL